MMTFEEVCQFVSYDPETGFFSWIFPKQGRRPGKQAGTITPMGYRQICINGETRLAHRLAWLLSTRSWPTNHIDHINGIKDDNRLCNLREATCHQNLCNASLNKRNTSGVKGVSRTSRNRWTAQIVIDGKRTSLGNFRSIEEAESVIKAARDQHHGEFANHG